MSGNRCRGSFIEHSKRTFAAMAKEVTELTDLSAAELARLDAICLDFENDLRRTGAKAVAHRSIERIVRDLGGEHQELLRRELEAVADEVGGSEPPESSPPPVDRQPPSPSPRVPQSPRDENGEIEIPAAEIHAAETPAATSATGDSQASLEGELPRPGDSIGPYRIEGELGRGGMGIVYRAIDTRLDRMVAIKMLSVGGVHHAELVERFQREAKAVAKISHPNIVELFDVGQSRGLPYAVMEILEGQTLMQRLRQGPLSTEQVRQIGTQIADALATSHAAGVIHRDLKPHNVMLMSRRSAGESGATPPSTLFDPANDATLVMEPGGSPALRPAASSMTTKLFDFGLSRFPRHGDVSPEMVAEIASAEASLLEPSVSLDASTSDGQNDETRTGMILGTPGYMAPEQARGEAVTPAADLFSLGCVLFEAFYGRRAFDGPTSADRFTASLHQEPLADPSRRRDDPELADIIDRCLQKSIDRRPASAADVAAALRPKAAASTGDHSTFG